jgi:putative ATPase
MQNQQPWADLVRPEKIKEMIGQKKLLKERSFLMEAIERDNLPSMIFWGPPGSGKTSLAHVISKKTKSEFINFSAATSGVGEIRKIVQKAEEMLKINQKTILFIDEIHRFNKKQQDILLPYVEKGTLTLIGATTENPSFEVNAALLSRARVFVLERLDQKAIKEILKQALKKINQVFNKKYQLKDEYLEIIAKLANGDARSGINALEMILKISEKRKKAVNQELIKQVFQKSHLLYDKNGEEHYNIISALHKSIRGGDANAAVYWLNRMIVAGEDPLYIARRLVRLASEDIGLANNSALMLATSTYQACHFIGLPECDAILTHCVIYLAKSKKDITAYTACKKAKKDIQQTGNLEVPLHLRNAPTKLMKDLNYGKDYKYSPDYNWKEDQVYLPDELKGRRYV